MRNIFAHNVLGKVEKTLSTFGMFEKGESVLVCVSGGADSVALLHILSEISRKHRLALTVAHMNHMLRGKDADSDAAFVSSMAQRLGIPCITHNSDVAAYQKAAGVGLEEAGRHLRYNFFRRSARQAGATTIALGHHGDDNAESVLMYMLRGAAGTGMAGIRPVRIDRSSGLRIVRPLCELERSQIEAYLLHYRLPFVEDASNRSMHFLRNRIRHELMPYLKRRYNPRVAGALNRLADVLRTEDEWIEGVAQQRLSDAVVSRTSSRIELDAAQLATIHKALLRRVVRCAIRQIKGDLRRITHTHVDAVAAGVGKKEGRDRVSLPGGLTAYRNGDLLVVSDSPVMERSIQSEYHYRFDSPGDYSVEEAGIRIKLSILKKGAEGVFKADRSTAFLDLDYAAFPLTLRTTTAGERFRPLGMSGSQKTRTFLANNKIPPSQRAFSPVLASGDRFLWLVGHRIDDRAKVTPDTQSVLKCEVFLA